MFLQLAAILGLSAFPLTARAQGLAKCINPSWDWSFNSKGQDPCAVSQNLRDQCTPTFDLPPLPSGYYYSGQNTAYATECACNVVYYTLLSACAMCQNGLASDWPEWNRNCSQTTSDYPKQFPVGLSVPDWAFLPLSGNSVVNFTTASLDQNPDHTSNPSTTSGKTNVGAIAGGVVGGVAFLVIVSLSVWFFLRRWTRKKRNANSNAVTVPAELGREPTPATVTAPMTPVTGTSMKLYDPDDKSTYPPSMSIPPTVPQYTPYTQATVPMAAQYAWQGNAPPPMIPQV